MRPQSTQYQLNRGCAPKFVNLRGKGNIGEITCVQVKFLCTVAKKKWLRSCSHRQ